RSNECRIRPVFPRKHSEFPCEKFQPERARASSPFTSKCLPCPDKDEATSIKRLNISLNMNRNRLSLRSDCLAKQYEIFLVAEQPPES
ncbi:hypothetical protein HHI36_015989, partial [Cryptolaemus montrouzieri]